jgi:hypothetical protein
MADQSYIGKGTVYIREKDAAGPMYSVGNVSKLEFGVTEEKKELKNFQSAGGGLANSLSRIDKVEASFTLHDLSTENLAMALYGDTSAVTAAAVTDESHTAYLGGLIRLANLPNLSETITVTDSTGTTTYVLNTDYTVTRAGIIPLAGGSIVEASTILVDYTKLAGNVVEAITNSAKEWEMVFDGLNEAQSGKAVVIDVHRLKFGPPTGIGFIADDFAGLELKADLLADTSITGTGLSQYFKVEMAA